MLQNIGFRNKVTLVAVAMALVALVGAGLRSYNELETECRFRTLVSIDDPATILLTRAPDKLNALLYGSHRMVEEAGTPALAPTLARYRVDVAGMKLTLDAVRRIDPKLGSTVDAIETRFLDIETAMDAIAGAAATGRIAGGRALLARIDRDGVTLAIDIGILAANRVVLVQARAAALTHHAAVLITSSLAIMATLIAAGLLGVIFVSDRGIVVPLLVIRDEMLAIAQGRLDITISHTARRDEVGAMAQALETIRTGLRNARGDALTDLAGRLAFEARMKAIFAARAADAQCAVIYIDLDGFKQTNDSFGHSLGDSILRIAAERIKACLGQDDFAARLGGDEFVVLRGDARDRAAMERLATRLAETLRTPVTGSGGPMPLSASLGIAYADPATATPQGLMHQADLAMYAAKEDGGGNWRSYRPEMLTDLDYSRGLKTDLRAALQAGAFSIVFQPILDVRSGRIASCEALLRWEHPRLGSIQPARFVPFAEKIGLMPDIDDWVLLSACRAADTWPTEIAVSVNISATRLHRPGLIATVGQALAISGLTADRLEIEITETSMIADMQRARATLAALRELGVKVAMDDFGTGYSSLSFLTDIPFTRIKIDRSFVRELGESAAALAIVRALINIGHDLKVQVTAEGVETAAQASQLRQEGCFFHQGYLISPPRSAETIVAWLNRPVSSAPGLMQPG